MPKWKKDAKEFTVSVNFNESRGYQSSIPKPIMDVLGDPTTLKFVMSNEGITIMPGLSSGDMTPTKINIENSNKGVKRKRNRKK
jgi:hypothetical protein